eukprot:NODE_483_length_7824_cov_0.163625.p4 type:complete len:198 gc:universal NODE_483_length_7824_cov_0.163625:364-957(+)
MSETAASSTGRILNMTRGVASAPLGWVKEFKVFLIKGNVIALAIAFVMGNAFQAIVTSFVVNFMNPIIGLASVNNLDLLYVAIKGNNKDANGKPYATPADANKNGVVTLNLGAILSSIILFILISLFCFLMTKILIDSIMKQKKEDPTTKPCAMCCEDVKLLAVICPYCQCKNPIREMKISDSGNLQEMEEASVVPK